MLVRPGMEVEKEEVELDPNDPLAEEKQRLRDWEDSLNLTADALTERLRLLAERETALVERERTFARREAALESREAALSNRERLVRAREKLPEVRPWAGPRAPSIVGKYAMVIDARNGRILHQKDAYEAIPVASTQKLLTALLVVEAGDLEREIVVEASDTKVEPSVLGFKTGETYTRKELVQWLMVRSGNDVALALARDNAGSVELFCERMNARAKELGMTNSHFKNPHGLTVSGQYSTARDMALLAWHCYQDPFIRDCVATKKLELRLDSGVLRSTTNTNKLLQSNGYCNGMKTGYTIASGNCLISSGMKGERERIVAVFKSSSTWVSKDSGVLLDWSLASD
ncbi:MAG: serine hydrolase [Verrucomicrobiota bacterium]